MSHSYASSRVFIYHLKDCVNVDQFRKIMEEAVPATSILHFFTIPNESIGIVDVDKHSTAKKIKELFHGQTFYGNKLEVKTMGHRAKVWVGRLCPAVSNEYLQQAFETFGKVQRARVVAGSSGESANWGFIEFVDPESAQKAVQTCEDHCFMLTRSGPPVQVEFWNEMDTYYGVREQFCKREGVEKKETSIAPRLAEKGAFEYDFARRWKNLAEEEQRLKDELHDSIMKKRHALLLEHRKALDSEESRRMQYQAPPKVNPMYPPQHPPSGHFPPGPNHGGYSRGGHPQKMAPSISHNSYQRGPSHGNYGNMPPSSKPRNHRMPPPPTNAHMNRHHPYR